MPEQLRMILTWRKLYSPPPSNPLVTDGIKRGLTAVEAAALIGLPLDKVILLMLFGAIEKGAVEVVSLDPIRIRIVDSVIEGLHHYEIAFLKAFEATDKNVNLFLLQGVIAGLIEYVAEKMDGFKRQETINHYESIVQEALQEMKNVDLPVLKNIVLADIPGWSDLVNQYRKVRHDAFEKSQGTSFLSKLLETYSAAALEYKPNKESHSSAKSYPIERDRRKP